jgi:hypothetical protein
MNKISHNSNNDLHGFVWQNARKREIVVAVEFSRQPDIIETLEGLVRCGVGDAIITGVRGEQWPVQRELFEKLYEPIHPLPMGKDGRYCSLSQEVEVVRLTVPFCLELTGQQGTLAGNTGDWLVRKPDGSMGIVAGNIFSKTYDLVK